MKKTEKRERMAQIVEALKAQYPQAICALCYEGEPWKLLVMGRLSAQCTDARVNSVCRELFARFPTPRALADADIAQVEAIVRPCGLFHTKARNIIDACRMLCEEYGGVLPGDMEALLRFPGVGRKIANLLRGDIFGLPAIVADTHCIRLCGRFGMYPTKEKDPARVEKILSSLIVPDEQNDFCHRVVQLGREFCTARSPKCDACVLGALCEYGGKMQKKAGCDKEKT